MTKKTDPGDIHKVFDHCPHCGRPLSPWERVLLGVDRALTCKHCWYRILLTIDEKDSGDTSSDHPTHTKDTRV